MLRVETPISHRRHLHDAHNCALSPLRLLCARLLVAVRSPAALAKSTIDLTPVPLTLTPSSPPFLILTLTLVAFLAALNAETNADTTSSQGRFTSTRLEARPGSSVASLSHWRPRYRRQRREGLQAFIIREAAP